MVFASLCTFAGCADDGAMRGAEQGEVGSGGLGGTAVTGGSGDSGSHSATGTSGSTAQEGGSSGSGSTTAATSDESSGADTGSTTPVSGTESDTTAALSSTSSSSTTGPADDPIVSIDITPKDVLVEVVNGVIPADVDFEAEGTTMGGAKVPLLGKWTYDRYDVASLENNDGIFTATGLVGGAGTVMFDFMGMTAETGATVKIVIQDDGGVDPTVQGDFDNPSGPDPSLDVLYPYDTTVFPRGLTGPTLQWDGGTAGNTYKLAVTSPYFEYEGFFTADPPSRWDWPTVAEDLWLKFTDSTVGDATMALQRHDGAQAYDATTHTWTIAPADLTGTVYYWESQRGDVVRIKPGDTMAESFITKPDESMLPSAANPCGVACHSVSKNGERIIASYGHAGDGSPWATFDSATGAIDYQSNAFSGFQAISPEGDYVLWKQWTGPGWASDGSMTLSLFNSDTSLAQMTPPPASGFPAMPAWSVGGEKIAFSMRTNGNGVDFTDASIWTVDVDLVTPGMTNYRELTLAQSGVVGENLNTFPTWSPDDAWIAYQSGNHSRARTSDPMSPHLGNIRLVATDNSQNIDLDAANGVGHLTGDELNSSFEPTFLPVAQGGYFWLVFVSERAYGNTLTDTTVTSRRKQLWVAAIDADPTLNPDPSHRAFWLPGQTLATDNMRGYWALNPCKELGESCEAGFDCCDGFCRDDGAGALVCSTPDPACSRLGEACNMDSDCCDEADGAQCIGGFCSVIPG